ncbi:GNAT family N-acetyltransferase [Enterococcus raffinosus]|nr:GNAT family N-acetyltransferase [Enterococcus raffinosus]MBU5361915.1 GNAT family N-acetyltransferase [Enterococcus raffinosus]
MEYLIREMHLSEYPLLREFLYQAIYQRDQEKPIPRSIINDPNIAVYIQDFGKYKTDLCLCAQLDDKVVGAVWVRNIEGFGSIDDQTPEFAISLLPEYRGQGIGTELMKAMIRRLNREGYSKTSLAVQKDNYALNMYLKVGFEIVAENGEEYIMVCQLK